MHDSTSHDRTRSSAHDHRRQQADPLPRGGNGPRVLSVIAGGGGRPCQMICCSSCSARQPYSASWLWLGLALLIFAVIAWYVGVCSCGRCPPADCGPFPACGEFSALETVAAEVRQCDPVDRRRHAAQVNCRHRRRARQISRTMRSFLHQATGIRAQYMHVETDPRR